jgi:Raf kinase inhibitor-like YbhB/YbcL family protein
MVLEYDASKQVRHGWERGQREGMKMRRFCLVCLMMGFCFLVVSPGNGQMKGGQDMAITVTSASFKEGGMIPKQYTCDGKDVSPPLAWSGVPDGAKSIALICDDPDAPMGTWVHWVLFNLPPGTDGLAEGVPSSRTLENGAKHGANDFRKFGYGGPCPPGGTHRYYFKVYGLDTMLDLDPGITKADLVKAMKGHILGEGQLMGRYKRQ